MKRGAVALGVLLILFTLLSSAIIAQDLLPNASETTENQNETISASETIEPEINETLEIIEITEETPPIEEILQIETPAEELQTPEPVIEQQPEEIEEVEQALQQEPTVNVIVILKDNPKTKDLEERKEQIDANQQDFKEELPAQTGFGTASADVVIEKEYETINAITAEVTQEGLEQLQDNPEVAQVVIDPVFHTSLYQSVPLINADTVHNLTIGSVKLNGSTKTVCVLDTGITLNHSVFAGRIHSGYDYVNNDSNPTDDASDSHGTHVSGIVAGHSPNGTGTAPGATILPYKVCNSAGSCTGSAILSGIDACNNASATYNITAMSISIADHGQYNVSNCPTFFDSAFSTSNSLGIIPVVASGNDAFTNGVSYPACSPYALSVGSSTKSDVMSSFTNRGGNRLDVLAPGSGIISSVSNGSVGVMSGTSMATPHVSGVITLLQQNQQLRGKANLTLAQLRALLNSTGVNVSGYKRIDAYNAISHLNHGYLINTTNNSIIANSTSWFTSVSYHSTMNLTGLAECGTFNRTFAGINSTACPQFNRSARITFTGLSSSIYTILRDGAACGNVCQNITFTNGNLSFDVTGWSNFSASDTFPANVTEDSNLTSNITVNGTAFIFTNENITFDCRGFTITGNGTGTAFNATNRRNITILNCIITNFSIGIDADFTNIISIRNNTITNLNTAGWPINVLRTNHTTIFNNSINGQNDGLRLGGNNNTIQLNHVTSVQSHGITITTLANTSMPNNFVRGNSSGMQTGSFGSNLTIVNSTYYGNSGRGLNFGDLRSSIVENNSVYSESESAMRHQSGTNNNFSNNNFTANTFNGIAIDDTGNRLHNTIIMSNGTWMFINAAGNNVSNLTFRNLNGSINISNTTLPNIGGFITQSQLNITSNGAFVNSSNLSFFNTTATITLYNRTNPSLGVRVDFEDDGSFAICPSTICSGVTFSSGTLTFSVTQFTTYSSNDTFPATLLQNGTLTSNISANGSAITFGTDNITLDCNGFTMTGNQSGTGIAATNRINITVKNCIIRNFDRNIFFTSVNSSFLDNVTLINASQENILLSSNTYNILNRINSTGNTTTTSAVSVSGGSNITIGNSTFSHNSSGNNAITAGGSNHTLLNVTTTGLGTSGAMRIDGENMTIRNSTAIAASASGFTSVSSSGFIVNDLVSRSNTNVAFVLQTVNHGRFNNITASSAGPVFLYFLGGGNNSFENITSTGYSSVFTDSIYNIASGNATFRNINAITNVQKAVSVSAANVTIITANITSNSSWIATESGATSTNLTNITFITANGSIRLTNTTLIVPNSTIINQTHLNIMLNKAFLNSSNLSFFNTTSQIILNNLTTPTAQALVDLEDDNTFAPCVSPRCTFISYTGGTFTFNVTGWTAYSSTEGGVTLSLNKTDSTDPVTSGQHFNYTITVNVTEGVAFNTSVRETLPTGIAFITSQPTPSSIQSQSVNYTIGNLTNGTVFRINISVFANSSVLLQNTTLNNTAVVNYSNSTGNNFQTNVTEQTNITISLPLQINSTTNLTTNFSGNILINSSNIELNCNGNTLQGTGSGSGITFGTNITGATATNCVVNNFLIGINMANASQSHINNVTTNITTSSIVLSSTAQNNNIANSTFEATSTWVSTDITSNTTLTNNTFANSQGTLRVIPTATMPNSTSITTNNLNVGTRTANLNSATLTFLNTTSQIKFYNVSVTAPVMVVDFQDDGSTIQCPSNICTQDSFTGTTFVMNVTRWTTYGIVAGGATVTVTKQGYPDPVLNGTELIYQITVSVLNGMAVNFSVFEFYPANTTFNSSQPTPTSGNNFFNLGNLTENTTFIINISLNVSSNFTGTLTNNITVNFSNSTGGNSSTNITETTTVLNAFPTSSGGGSGGGGGGGGSVCYPICSQPGYETLPQCRNCPPKIAPVTPVTTPTFPSTGFTPKEETGSEQKTEPTQEQLPEPEAIPIPETKREPVNWAKYSSTFKNVLWAILIILAVLAVAYGGYYAYKNKPKGGMKHDIGGLLSEIKETEDKLKHMKGKFS